MSDKTDTGTDRRTLIVAAAAASIAAARPSPALNPQPEPPHPTQIKVDLGGVRLPVTVAKELEAQINRDVLGAIARAGVKGNVVRPGGLGPGIYGIIYRPVALQGAATHG